MSKGSRSAYSRHKTEFRQVEEAHGSFARPSQTSHQELHIPAFDSATLSRQAEHISRKKPANGSCRPILNPPVPSSVSPLAARYTSQRAFDSVRYELGVRLRGVGFFAVQFAAQAGSRAFPMVGSHSWEQGLRGLGLEPEGCTSSGICKKEETAGSIRLPRPLSSRKHPSTPVNPGPDFPLLASSVARRELWHFKCGSKIVLASSGFALLQLGSRSFLRSLACHSMPQAKNLSQIRHVADAADALTSVSLPCPRMLDHECFCC